MKRPEPSNLPMEDLIQLRSFQKEEIIKLDSTRLTVNGGNSSDMRLRLVYLSTLKERYLMSGKLKTSTTDKYSFKTDMVVSTSNGRSSMNGANQQRDNSTRTSASMLKDHSTSYHNFQEIDISTGSTTTWSSRLQTVTIHRNGSSTKDQELLRILRNQPSHGILLDQASTPTFKSTIPTVDGGRSSELMDNTLSMSRTTRSWTSLEVKISKDKTFKSTPDIREPTSTGRLSMLIPLKINPRDLTSTSDSESTSHSTLSQDCQ